MAAPGLIIRDAREADFETLLRIYNHYVTHTHATFDTAPRTAEERRPWFDGFAADGPHRLLVAEVGGTPVGYASSQQIRPKPAYRTSVETTIYLDPEHTGRGIGRTLYTQLLETLRGENLHRAFAGIALPNDVSIRLHESLGFERLGIFREVGFKFGKYWDVAWYELSLG